MDRWFSLWKRSPAIIRSALDTFQPFALIGFGGCFVVIFVMCFFFSAHDTLLVPHLCIDDRLEKKCIGTDQEVRCTKENITDWGAECGYQALFRCWSTSRTCFTLFDIYALNNDNPNFFINTSEKLRNVNCDGIMFG